MSAIAGRWERIIGLVAGPACWGIFLEVAEVVTFLACDQQRAILVPLGATLIVISIAGGLVSLFMVSSVGEEWFDKAGGRAGPFLGAISLVTGLLFALVIADQLAATFIVERCSR
jgi:hypothetical protein